MAALGALFDEDATFVNRLGHLLRGIDEIRRRRRRSRVA